MLLTKEVEMTWTNNRKIYEPWGYVFTKKNDSFVVKIEHLSEGSNKFVSVKCDYCGDINEIQFISYNKYKKNNIIDKDCCSKCQSEKVREQSLLRYNCKNPAQKDIKVEDIISEFKNRNYYPLFSEYEDSQSLLHYVCEKHADKGVQAVRYRAFKCRGDGCYYCGMERTIDSKRKYNLESVKADFKEKGYTLVSKKYISTDKPLLYTCDKHPELKTQKVIYWSFKTSKHSCKQCSAESTSRENSVHWKGGISSLSEKLRKRITPWMEDSKMDSQYKCVITNKESSLVHHLYSFHGIVEESLKYFNMDYNSLTDIKLNELENYQINQISEKCLELHYKYGFGVCLSEDIHILFHNLYGRQNNTPQQFAEFKLRYEMGEFTEQTESTQSQTA